MEDEFSTGATGYVPNMPTGLNVQPNMPEPVDTEEPVVPVESEEEDKEEVQPDEPQKKGGLFGTGFLDYSGGGFIYGTKERPGPLATYSHDSPFGERMMSAGVGVLDTVTDFVNWVIPGDKANIPKVPEYEDNVAQSIRNISGLVIPALTTRGMLLQSGAKMHAAKTAPVWMQNLGNRKSFQYIARFGADIFTGGMVDYVAEQNQKDDNFAGTLKKYWPTTFQWIPDTFATTDADSPDVKRQKNVNEGAVFGMLSSIVEGVAYLTRSGKSIRRLSAITPSTTNKGEYPEFVTEFDRTIYSDNPMEDTILRGYDKKVYELDLLGEYYLRRGDVTEPTVGVHDIFDEGETLVRSKDSDGIIGASIDAAQVRNNIDTEWGRLGNIIHEAARKNGIDVRNIGRRTLVQEQADILRRAKGYSKTLNSGKKITEKMIQEAGNVLAATLLNPRLDPDDIIGLLDSFQRSIDDSLIRIVGKRGINKAIKELRKQMVDLDLQKARAYLVTSEAGQIADFSEGARLMDGGVSVNRTIDLMADRLEVLMVEKGLANFEANSLLGSMRVWQDAVDSGDPELMEAAANAITSNHSSRLLELVPNAKRWTQTLKDVARENPEFIKPLLLANEMTDGNVDSLYKLHSWAAENLGTFRKAVYDGNPAVPSIVNKAIWSNLFNSALSAFGTPVKAAVGNLTGLLGRGSATVIGAVRSGDLPAARRAMTAFFSLDDTLQASTDHMRLVFRKASLNPKDVDYVMRGDVAIKEERGLEALRAYAEAGVENGEYGAAAMVRLFEDLEAIAMDPVLRFGGNSMTALDGFSRSIVANTEAKYIELNKLAQSGEEISEDAFKEAYQNVYNKWFDDKGMIQNEAVDVATREIALNADSPVVDGMNTLIKRFPAARAFVWFPRTTANVIDTFGKWSPAGIFARDHHQLWGGVGWFANKKITDFTDQEIAEVLTRKGFPVDEYADLNFERIRHEVRGKAAIGGYISTLAFFAAANDRCTGTGHYDPARQRQRIKSGWKPKTCKAPGGKVVSYEWMGPIGDWLALSVDIVDNFDNLSTSQIEDLWNKSLFVLSSALTNRSVLAQLEPLYDVLRGNGAAAQRFGANFLNLFLPLGSQRNELGKVLSPGLRQLRSELDDALRNRNAWLDKFDQKGALPFLVDPVDGTRIGYQENWFIRAWNVYSPIKIHDQPGKERQFLIDIEFNSSPQMNVSTGGALLENKEIELINSKMGEQGIYKAEINKIMKRANKLTYTMPNGKVITGFTNIIQAVRRGWVSSEVLDTAEFAGIYADLKYAYSQAKRIAEDSIDAVTLARIRDREYDREDSIHRQRVGDVEEILNY